MIYENDDLARDIRCRPMTDEQRRLEDDIRRRPEPKRDWIDRFFEWLER